jgi:4'-phosphopantetheinyl transferase
MSSIYPNGIVHCYSLTNILTSPDDNSLVAEVFFAKTNDFNSEYSTLKNFINSEDKLKADRLHLDEEKLTYLFCHTLLRLVLSRRLNIDPKEISIVYDKNKKPCLQGNPLFFNITHSRDAFAFAISQHSRVGVDLEKVNRDLDFVSVIKRFFSSQESEFILASPGDSMNRFFLLWTRKEALLKALGTGIITNLSRIEVLKQKNILDRKLFDNILDDSLFCDYFIYSKKISDYYLSIAVTQKSTIIIHQPDVGKDVKSNYLLSLLRSYR